MKNFIIVFLTIFSISFMIYQFQDKSEATTIIKEIPSSCDWGFYDHIILTRHQGVGATTLKVDTFETVLSISVHNDTMYEFMIHMEPKDSFNWDIISFKN